MKTYKLIFFYLITLLFNHASAQYSKLDSLKLISNSKIDTISIKQAYTIANEICESEPKQTLLCINQILKKYNHLDYNNGKAKLYNIKGICFDILSEYDSALINYNAAYKIANEYRIPKIKASSLNNIGMVYWNIGKYDEAIKFYFSALKQFELINSEKNIANVNNNIGLINFDMGNFEESIKYYNIALRLYKKNNDDYGIGSAQTNLGISYYYKKNYKLSKAYLDSSIVIKRKIDDQYGLAISLTHQSELFILSNDYNLATKNLKEAEAILIKIGNKNMLLATYDDLGHICMLEKKYAEAERYNLKMLEISREIGSIRKEQLAAGNLSIIYGINKNFEKAFNYLQITKTISDSILNIDNYKNLSVIQEKFQTEKKEKENITLSLENNKQKNKISWIVFGGILLVIISSLTIWIFMFKRKQQLMHEQNIKLNETVFETELLERERIARDLHDSVGQKLSVVKMQLSLKNADTHSAIKLLDETIQEVREVSHNLIPADLNKGLIAALENMCEQINYHSQNLKIHLNHNIIYANLKKQEESFIYRISQELVNNAIKYSQAKNIFITINDSKNTIHIEVKDDGIGFDISELKNKNGIGIKNIQDRVEKMNGSWQLESKKNSGTSYNIKLLLS